ncbi:unnamed protein product, partial [Didymodactylos carnosus]
PIELCWAELKAYVRAQNTTFKLQDVEKLTWKWLDSCDSTLASSFIEHVHLYEENFQKADHFMEQVESELDDTDDIDTSSDLNEDEDLQLLAKSNSL